MGGADGTVVLCPGTFTIDTTIVVPSNVEILAQYGAVLDIQLNESFNLLASSFRGSLFTHFIGLGIPIFGTKNSILPKIWTIPGNNDIDFNSLANFKSAVKMDNALELTSDNSALAQTTYSRIDDKVIDDTAGSETGHLVQEVISSGTFKKVTETRPDGFSAISQDEEAKMILNRTDVTPTNGNFNTLQSEITNSNNDQEIFSKIRFKAIDITAGAEEGSLELLVKVSGLDTLIAQFGKAGLTGRINGLNAELDTTATPSSVIANYQVNNTPPIVNDAMESVYKLFNSALNPTTIFKENFKITDITPTTEDGEYTANLLIDGAFAQQIKMAKDKLTFATDNVNQKIGFFSDPVSQDVEVFKNKPGSNHVFETKNTNISPNSNAALKVSTTGNVNKTSLAIHNDRLTDGSWNLLNENGSLKIGLPTVPGDPFDVTNTIMLFQNFRTSTTKPFDAIDSLSAGPGTNRIKWKILEIGIWDMTSTVSVFITHDLTLIDIISITCQIRSDSGGGNFTVPHPSTNFKDFDVSFIGTGNLTLGITRRGGGLFDSASFSSVVINRGTILIHYK